MKKAGAKTDAKPAASDKPAAAIAKPTTVTKAAAKPAAATTAAKTDVKVRSFVRFVHEHNKFNAFAQFYVLEKSVFLNFFF